MVKLRLAGLPADVEKVTEQLYDLDSLMVVDVSADYPNRGTTMMVRRYVTVKLLNSKDTKHD